MRKAFTLIEIVLVIGLIALITSILLPRLTRRNPAANWQTIQQEMTNLIALGRQEAIMHHSMHRLSFVTQDQEHKVILEATSSAMIKQGIIKYAPVTSPFAPSTYTLPPSVKISNVYFGEKTSNNEKKDFPYCLISPDGIIQPINITFNRTENGKTVALTLSIEPFTGVTYWLNQGSS